MSEILTPEMVRALKIIKENGCLVWYAGGYWHKPDAEMVQAAGAYYPKDYIRTNTLKAMETRGLIRFTQPASMVKSRSAVVIVSDALTYSSREVLEIVRAAVIAAGGNIIHQPHNTPLLPCTPTL